MPPPAKEPPKLTKEEKRLAAEAAAAAAAAEAARIAAELAARLAAEKAARQAAWAAARAAELERFHAASEELLQRQSIAIAALQGARGGGDGVYRGCAPSTATAFRLTQAPPPPFFPPTLQPLRAPWAARRTPWRAMTASCAAL